MSSPHAPGDRKIARDTPVSAVLAHPDARAILERIVPEVLASPIVRDLSEFPIGPVLGLVLGEGHARVREATDALACVDDTSPLPPQDAPIAPRGDLEGETVPRGGAPVVVTSPATVHTRLELALTGPSHGNPFVDVELTAVFEGAGSRLEVGGFYDGDGMYRVRFLPPAAGTWHYVTRSTTRSLDGIEGVVEVTESDERGPVRVADRFHFAYADGTPYTPVGTTAYAWTLQDETLQDETVRTLAGAPFTKIRMGLFPKAFLFNEDDPEHYPFLRRDDNSWDTTRFDLEYFRRLECRIDGLGEIGVEADLILFHPYDRWGFAALGAAADDRYVAYVVRRLSAFVNVWWSMANEYDLLTAKRPADWERLANLVRANDPVGHPLSIHNWVEVFDYATPWATHASLQRGDHALGDAVVRWRERWGKPVIVDETGYEGDIDQLWGNLTPQEMVRRFWAATIGGGYATHGETFASPDDVLWWAKGGRLHGESPARIAFLRGIIEESPTGRIDPLVAHWDYRWAGVADRYILIYYGESQPSYRVVMLPEGMTARIDVIDTWNMTIDEVPGEHRGEVRVALPGRPYIAVRLRAVDTAGT